MKPLNFIFHATCLAFLLLFFLIARQAAVAEAASLPASIAELLSGKTADYNNVACQVSEHQLPVALAAARLLKFRALHDESPLSINEATAFEELLLERISSARQIAFSQNEICRQMVPQQEIEFNGQKLVVPTHYLADTTLAVIDFKPQGEAGCLFPDFNIEVFSQTRLTKVTLAIDGQTVDSGGILLKQNADCFSLLHRTAALSESLLKIGTHSAHISIVNEAGEKAEKKWLFTVGVESFNPEPIPEDARFLNEIQAPVSQLIAATGSYQNIRVLIYEDGCGRRHEEYIVTTDKDSITVRNLKYLGKILTTARSDPEFQIFPKTRHAFPGNRLRFFYNYSGAGRIVESDYSLTGLPDTWQNGAVYEATLASEAIKVFFRIKVEVPDPEVENETISFHCQADHGVSPLFPKFSFLNPRNYVFTIGNEASLPFKRELQVVGFKEPLEAGSKISMHQNGRETLYVDDFPAEIVVSSGSVMLKDSIATVTEILFSTPGYIEITQSAKLVYCCDDETYSQSFKDERSSLNALFKVNAECEFLKYPQVGLISGTQVTIPLRHLRLQINGETRLYKSLADIEQPWVLLKSEHDPQMAPIVLQNPYFHIEDPAGKNDFGLVDFGYSVLTAVTDEPLAVKPEFMVTPGFSPIKFASLQEFSIFPKDSRLIQVAIDPPGPHTIFEGDTRPFFAAIVPVEGMGSGIFSAEGNSLEILDFYKPSEIDYFDWLELPIIDEKSGRTVREAEFEHLFNPWCGPGEYELSVDSLVDFKTEAGSTFYLKAANKTKVEVMPGLTILSPISDVAYPLGAALKVTTSVDDDLEKWKSIKWSLNGKDFKPDTQEPPFFITPDRAGKYSLVASMTITADEDREPVEVMSEVKFSVQPVDYSLSPARKIFPGSEVSDIAVDLIVKINGKQVEKPGQQVPWQKDALSATIDKVEWDLVQKEEGCASLKAEDDSFKAMIDFSSHGAATVLATITIRLTDAEKVFNRHNPHFKDRFEEPVFKLPAARADLWAIGKPVWEKLNSTLPDEQFPRQAVSPAGRTFTIKDGVVKLNGETYPWSPQADFQEPILIPAAVEDPEIAPVTCKKIKLEWFCTDNTPSNSFLFIPTFKKSGPAIVKLRASLVFDSNDEVFFVEKIFPVTVEDIANLVRYYIEPQTFQMTLGETKKFDFFINPIESPVPAADYRLSEFALLSGIYRLTVDRTEWSAATANETFLTKADSVFDFTPEVSGAYKLGCSAYCSIIEDILPQSGHAPSWPWNPKATNNVTVVNGKPEIVFFVDDISLNDLPKIYLGQKIRLSFKAFLNGESVPIGSYTWQVDQPFASEFRIIGDDQSRSEIIPGKVIDNHPVEFLVYSFDRHDKRKTFCLTYDYDGQTHTQAGEFSFIGPDITKYGYEQLKPTIFSYTGTGGTVTRFGYHPPGDGIIPGHFDVISAKNSTDVGFALYFGQLISIDFSRGYGGSPVDERAIFNHWLDGGFPYLKPGLEEFVELLPGEEVINDTDNFEDSPGAPYQEDPAKPEPIWYNSNTKFSVFVFARPNLANWSFVPILRYDWSWRANSEREGTTWSEVEGSFFPPYQIKPESVKEIPLANTDSCELGFPTWVEKYEGVLPWK